MKALNTLWKVVLLTVILASAGLVNAAPVDVNTADAETLAQNISGIGPKKAQAIVNYRIQNGPFKSTQDLIKVKGIGPKIVEMNKSNFLFSDATAKKVKQSAKN